MSWKEFLKPGLLKIVIAAAIFFVIWYFFIFIPSHFIYNLAAFAATAMVMDIKGACCNLLSQNQSLTPLCSDYTNRTGFVFTADSCNAYVSDRAKAARDYYIYSTVMFYAAIIASIVFSYLVSCLLVWLVFGRRKNVKQDERMQPENTPTSDSSQRSGSD